MNKPPHLLRAPHPSLSPRVMLHWAILTSSSTDFHIQLWQSSSRKRHVQTQSNIIETLDWHYLISMAADFQQDALNQMLIWNQSYQLPLQPKQNWSKGCHLGILLKHLKHFFPKTDRNCPDVELHCWDSDHTPICHIDSRAHKWVQQGKSQILPLWAEQTALMHWIHYCGLYGQKRSSHWLQSVN